MRGRRLHALAVLTIPLGAPVHRTLVPAQEEEFSRPVPTDNTL